MTLDITPFERSIARLDEGIKRFAADTSDTQVRDGLIQRFELTYESSHKTLKRYLESRSADPAAYDAMPFQDLIRSGNEQGLLQGKWPAWQRYRDLCSKAIHAYDEAVAAEVVTGIPAFFTEAVFLHSRLRQRL